MSFGDIGKSFERLLRCTNNALGASAGPQTKYPGYAYYESFRATNDIWQRLDARMSQAADDQEKAACAKAWLSAHLERKLFFRVELLLITIRERADVATCSSESATARQVAAAHVSFAGHTAFMLLSQACFMVGGVMGGSSKSGHNLGQKALSAMAQRSFMKAVAAASRGMAATAAFVRAAADARGVPAAQYPIKQINSCVFDIDPVMQHQYMLTGLRAGATSRYASFMAELLLERLGATQLTLGGRTGPAIPQAASQLADSLAESQLLAVAAADIFDCPNAMAIQGQAKMISDNLCRDMHLASHDAAQAMVRMGTNQRTTQALGGPEGRRLACILLRATRHAAVRRLQVALLDQLAAHAGMGPELGDGDGGQGQQHQGQDVDQADGWEGGTWWFAREEARRGQLLGLAPGQAGEATRRRTAGWLEEYHCRVVSASVWDWGKASPELAGEAGVPAAPPPVLRARLAARAAEALCRLYRGKGLGGAYAPSPEWSYAPAQVQSLGLVHKRQAGLSTPAAHASVPYRLEAAGWTAAVLSDAIAATMGRLPATTPTRLPLNPIKTWALEGTAPPGLLSSLMDDMVSYSLYDDQGFLFLPAAAQDDVRRRLSRCGLAASLDHALRLLHSAENFNQSGAATLAAKVSWGTLLLLKLKMMRLLPSTKASSGDTTDPASVSDAGACSSSGGSSSCGGSSSGGSSSSGSSGGGGNSSTSVGGSDPSDPLALLLTLSKRAAMLTRALEAVSAPRPAQGVPQEQRRALDQQHVLTSAGNALALMQVALLDVQGDLAQTVGEARTAVASAIRGDAAGAARQAPDAACVDDGHEALALAARAASNLAAALAWQLAAEPLASSDAEYLEMVGHAVQGLLLCMEGWCSYPLALPAAQLLACQPHRLLAASCALAAVLPASSEPKQPLCIGISRLVEVLSSHQTLGGRVRGWLAPPPTAADGGVASSTNAVDVEGDTYAGCLAGPLQSVPTAVAGAEGSGSLQPPPPPASSREGAAEMLDMMLQIMGDSLNFQHDESPFASEDGDSLFASDDEAPLLRSPSSAESPGRDESEADGPGLPPPQPLSVPPDPLPPPLVLPPSRAGALPRLYVCGNPRCANFGCEGEWALRLKQCGGCRAVRYCGAQCQRAHWREGHRAECKALAAGVGDS